jgi:hypothetical protein
MKRALPLIATFLLSASCGGTDVGDYVPSSTEQTAGVVEHTPSVSERADILAVLQAVFDGLAGDPELIANAMDEDVVMQYADARSGTAVFGSSKLQGLLQRVESSEEVMIERMWDAEVRVSGSLATIWTPYDFYIGSDFSHCGIDVATLMRRDNSWKIIGLDWTRDVPPSCALHPDGPPSS